MTHPCQPTVCGNAALASHVYKSNRVDVDKRFNEVGEGGASAHLYGIQFYAIIQAIKSFVVSSYPRPQLTYCLNQSLLSKAEHSIAKSTIMGKSSVSDERSQGDK